MPEGGAGAEVGGGGAETGSSISAPVEAVVETASQSLAGAIEDMEQSQGAAAAFGNLAEGPQTSNDTITTADLRQTVAGGDKKLVEEDWVQNGVGEIPPTMVREFIGEPNSHTETQAPQPQATTEVPAGTAAPEVEPNAPETQAAALEAQPTAPETQPATPEAQPIAPETPTTTPETPSDGAEVVVDGVNTEDPKGPLDVTAEDLDPSEDVKSPENVEPAVEASTEISEGTEKLSEEISALSAEMQKLRETQAELGKAQQELAVRVQQALTEIPNMRETLKNSMEKANPKDRSALMFLLTLLDILADLMENGIFGYQGQEKRQKEISQSPNSKTSGSVSRGAPIVPPVPSVSVEAPTAAKPPLIF